MRLHRWIVAAASRLVPRAARQEWRDEWDAELQHREAAGAQWTDGGGGHRIELLRRSTGAIWDALWLQSHRWYSLRLFGRHWRLATTAILSLAVAVAAVTIGLAAYNALMLRPPTVASPRTLRSIHIRTLAEPFGSASFPEYTTYREATRAFSDIAAYPYAIATASLNGRSPQIMTTSVSDNFFAVLGIGSRAGTLRFGASAAGDASEAVLSERLWRTLGGDPRIAGRTITLNDQPVTVVGVADGSFAGMMWGFDPDLWMSFRASEKVFGTPHDALTDRGHRTLHMVGRLRPGVTQAQAGADVASIAAAIAHDYPAVSRDHSAVLTALTVTPAEDRTWMGMVLGSLLAVVVLTLIVACTNVVNLLLGLAAARRHEMMVRVALGASRIQLIVPMVREAIMLAMTSAVLGYGAAWALLTWLAAFKPSVGLFDMTVSLDLRPDVLVLGVTIVVGLVVGVGVGLPPALRGASDGLSSAITREIVVGDARKSRLRHALIVIQMAVATVVLAVIGASLHSLFSLRHLPLGFTARHLVYCGLDVRRSGYDRDHAPAFLERVRARVSAIPGVDGVTLASDPPMMGYSMDQLTIDDAPLVNGRGNDMPYLVVDERYFSTIGVTVLRGRTFDSRDRAGGTDTAVVNETFVHRYFPDREPVGRRVRRLSDRRLIEIIVIVADGKYNEIDEAPIPLMYLSLAQQDAPIVTVIARSSGPRDAVLLALGEMDPHIVYGGVGAMTLDEALRVSTLLPLAIAWTTLVFGIIAIAMAMFGLYSTVFYGVSQRRRELAIRMALGASPRDLFAMVLGQTSRLAAAGAAIGLASGFALMPLAAAIFYGIAPVEPLAIGGAVLCVTAVLVLTTYSVVRPWTRLAAMDLLRQA
jgi:predicted permease